MKKTLTVLIFGAIALCLGAQERVYMPLFEVMNMHPDYEYSTAKLLATYVDNKNQYELILPERPDSLYRPETFSETQKNAMTLHCKYFIKGEMNRFGDVVIVTVKMYSTDDGTKVWQSILKALTPDDIDPIMQKLANSLGNKEQTSDESIYDVTQYDSKELNKIGATKSLGLTIGGGATFLGNITNNFPAGIGFVGSYDSRSVIFNINANAFFSDVKVYYIDIDAMYPFSSLKNSAYVMGGMGYGGVSIKANKSSAEFNSYYYDYDNAGGLLLFTGFGYILNRNSNVSVRFGGNLFFPLFKVNSKYPAGFLISTTILFGQ